MQFRFAQFSVDVNRQELQKGDLLVPMERKNFDLLVLLLRERDRVVSKEEIFESIWPGVFVTDASLSTAIAQIRKAIDDSGNDQKFIRTVRGKGFRFVAEVSTHSVAQITIEPAAAQRRADKSGTPPTIAVLPFVRIGSSKNYEAIEEAIPAELIGTLSRLRWLRVIARASSFRLSDTEHIPARVRGVLNADYVLSGDVELFNDVLSVTVELTDARSEDVIWGERISGKLDDVFSMREQIARHVITALEVRVPVQEAALLAHTPSENLTAWGHFHLGVRHMQTYSRQNNDIAEAHFSRAIELDPNFARAHAALAYTEFQNHFQKFGDALDLHRDRSLEAASLAIDLDPLDPFCNLNIGRARWLFGDAEAALGWTERALELNPNYAFGFYHGGMFQSVLCEAEDAERQIAVAIGLSPLDPHMQSMLGIRALAAFLRNELDRAALYTEESLRAPNAHLYVFMIGAIIYYSLNDRVRTEACLQKIRDRQVPFSSKDFLFHYNLRDPVQKRKLVDAVAKLGI